MEKKIGESNEPSSVIGFFGLQTKYVRFQEKHLFLPGSKLNYFPTQAFGLSPTWSVDLGGWGCRVAREDLQLKVVELRPRASGLMNIGAFGVSPEEFYRKKRKKIYRSPIGLIGERFQGLDLQSKSSSRPKTANLITDAIMQSCLPNHGLS